MASFVYDSVRNLVGVAGINLTSADLRVVMIDTADYTADPTHEFLDDVPSGARVGTPTALGSKTFGVAAVGALDAADTTLSSVSGDQTEALLIFVHTGTDSTARLVAYIDSGTGIVFTPVGTDVLITWPATGILRF